MASLVQELREVKDALEGRARYQDLAIALRREKNRETLLWAGGIWDRLERRYLDPDREREPAEVAVIDLEESQVPFTLWFAEFLADWREGYPRDVSLALNAGDRRGGKTFDTFACQIAALIDVPVQLSTGQPTVGWVISKSYQERDELEQLINGYIPSAYYRHQKAPERRFTFACGSYLRNLSADDPLTLKQGRVDILFYNEPQKMSAKAIKNGLFGTSDNGGITLLAANPPSPGEAEWLIDLKEGIEDDPEIKPIAKFFNFESKLNTKIDQPARRRVSKLARKIDPDGIESDDEGRWMRWGDLAYPAWNARTLDKGGLVGPVPRLGSADITLVVTKKKFYHAYNFVIGGDFQRRPQAAVVLKIFDDKDGPIYWFVDAIGVKGTEIELSDEVLGREYDEEPGLILSPDTALWVPDSTGSFQGSERIKGRTSFRLLEQCGWRVEPPENIKTEKAEHPKNPDVPLSLRLMERLMRERRIRVDPRAQWLIESFSKCQLGKNEYGRRKPKGVWSHASDAARYPVWCLEPKPSKPTPPPARARAGTVIVNQPPRGPRTL